MNKTAALHDFFSGFGIPAYPETSVPNDTVFPWLTYTPVVDSLDGGEVSLTVNLWYYTESESIPNAKAREIEKVIGIGGKILNCDDGKIWIKRGTPWCQSLSDDTDRTIKRRYINITAEYLTT